MSQASPGRLPRRRLNLEPWCWPLDSCRTVRATRRRDRSREPTPASSWSVSASIMATPKDIAEAQRHIFKSHAERLTPTLPNVVHDRRVDGRGGRVRSLPHELTPYQESVSGCLNDVDHTDFLPGNSEIGMHILDFGMLSLENGTVHPHFGMDLSKARRITDGTCDEPWKRISPGEVNGRVEGRGPIIREFETFETAMTAVASDAMVSQSILRRQQCSTGKATGTSFSRHSVFKTLIRHVRYDKLYKTG